MSIKLTKDIDELNENQQTKYRSGVGMLLYLVKHSRPDLANATRELSKMMKQASLYNYKELCWLIKYATDTSERKLLLNPTSNENKHVWTMRGICDSSFTGDPGM